MKYHLEKIKMKIRKQIILLFALTFLGNSIFGKEDCFPKPKKNRIVHDFANIIDQTVEQNLEQQLVNFNNQTTTQIAIVTVNSLCDYDRAMFTYEIGEQWGVGSKDFDNGLVIMVKPKTGNNRGQAFIAPGYGLEGVLPDATAKRIIEYEMIPSFKQNDYNSGISNAVQVIMEITGGEYSAENYQKKSKRKSKPFPVFPLIFIGFFIFIMLASTFRRARKYGARNNVGLWAALWLMGSMNNRHRGYYNNFRSGGGGFGGGSGFGGFGGGSFGGGGAGGSW